MARIWFVVGDISAHEGHVTSRESGDEWTPENPGGWTCQGLTAPHGTVLWESDPVPRTYGKAPLSARLAAARLNAQECHQGDGGSACAECADESAGVEAEAEAHRRLEEWSRCDAMARGAYCYAHNPTAERD